MKHIQAILFDLDGTLLDTLADLADSTNEALRRLGYPEHPHSSYKRFIGDGLDVLIQRALPKGCGDKATMAECARLTRIEYGQRWATTTRPYAGVPELLDGLVARGMPMAVLSNKPDEFTRLCVAELLPRWRFSPVLGADPTRPTKPDPAGAMEIARRLGIAADCVLYLGDTNTDMQTAVRAGMYPVGALWGFREADELKAGGAEAIIENPLDLLKILDG